ncbi:hypothetical protein [uncultured Legionella sp.]|uniref:hypothetical protein n=1 Tax=uncultured Legionella sp. TaxID=210934 RepID=UPI00261060D9|nr:hypothetical protein [uncultured Legionella sp.]
MLISLNKKYDTSQKDEYEKLLEHLASLDKKKKGAAYLKIKQQIESSLRLNATDLNLYKKCIGAKEIIPQVFKMEFVKDSDVKAASSNYLFLKGKFYILPHTEQPEDAVYALIDKYIYESMRHGLKEEPCISLRAAIDKFLLQSKHRPLAYFSQLLARQETAAKTYYSECLSEDSDSDDEQEFIKAPKKEQDAQNNVANTYRSTAQSSKFFKAFNQHAQVSDNNSRLRPIIRRPENFDRRQANSDLKAINERLKSGLSVDDEFLASLNTQFLVAQYRGIHYVTSRWDAEARREHREMDEVGKPQYSSAVFNAEGVEGYRDMINKTLTNPDFHTQLTQAAVVIENLLIAMQESDPCSFKGYAYQNLFLLLQKQYSSDYDGFPGWLDAELKKKNSILAEYLVNRERPLFSTSDVPNHALKYAFGVKLYEGHKDERLRPRWRNNLRAERPYSGKVYLSLHPLTDYVQHKPSHLTSLFKKGLVSLGNVIVAERETSFLAYMPEDRVAYHFKAKYPSFHGPYKTLFHHKYGISKAMYSALQKAFEELAPHSQERKNVIKSLGDYLSAFNEVRLVDKAQNLAIAQNSVLIYRDENGYFSLDLSDTPSTANKRLAPIIGAERELYKAIAEGRTKALQTISRDEFDEEEEKFRYVQCYFKRLLQNGYSLADFKSIPLEKLKLIKHDCLLSAVAENEITLDQLTDLTTEQLSIICCDAVIGSIEEEPDNLELLLSFSFEKLNLLDDEQLQELLEDDELSLTDIASCKSKELTKLLKYENLKKPLKEDYSLKNLLTLLKEDKNHIRCLTADDMTDLVLDEAPDVPDLILKYAVEEDVDFEFITQNLSYSERSLFKMCLDDYFHSDSDESEDEYSDEYSEKNNYFYR